MITWHAFARSICIVAASSVLACFTTTASAEPPATAEAGKLKVALNGDMPMTGLDSDQLIGTDGELMVLIAERLGLEVEPHMMD